MTEEGLLFSSNKTDELDKESFLMKRLFFLLSLDRAV